MPLVCYVFPRLANAFTCNKHSFFIWDILPKITAIISTHDPISTSQFIANCYVYNIGLTITADVRHSHVMGRQYLNVLFTPTAAFKGHTAGLCGVMDNDPSNDLKGPDDEQYKDPIQFADSCKWKVICIKCRDAFKIINQYLFGMATVSNGKRHVTFLELGVSQKPFKSNNGFQMRTVFV